MAGRERGEERWEGRGAGRGKEEGDGEGEGEEGKKSFSLSALEKVSISVGQRRRWWWIEVGKKEEERNKGNVYFKMCSLKTFEKIFEIM